MSSDQTITSQCHILMCLRYKALENLMRKREIAFSKQFLLLSQCFLPYMALISYSNTLQNVCSLEQCWNFVVC